MLKPSNTLIGYANLPAIILHGLEEYFGSLYLFQPTSHCSKIIFWEPQPQDVVEYYWQNLQGMMIAFAPTPTKSYHPCWEYVSFLNTPCRFQDLDLTLARKTNYMFYKVGPYLGDFQSRRLIHHTSLHCIDLTEKEAMTLQYLCQSPNHAIEREKLLKQVWKYNADLETHTLETHIYRLRQKLTPHENLLITTETGYMLVD